MSFLYRNQKRPNSLFRLSQLTALSIDRIVFLFMLQKKRLVRCVIGPPVDCHVSRRRGGITKQLSSLIFWCLSKEPNPRPFSAISMLELPFPSFFYYVFPNNDDHQMAKRPARSLFPRAFIAGVPDSVSSLSCFTIDLRSFTSFMAISPRACIAKVRTILLLSFK